MSQKHPGFTVSDFQIDSDLTKDERPTIGVVVSLWFPGMNDKNGKIQHDLTKEAVEALREAGARPVIIDSADTSVQNSGFDWHDEVDGFLYLGGADVHPGFFSDVPFSQSLPGVDVEADKFCVESVQRSVSDDETVLAICRGSQVLNVAMGGSILQHIDNHRAVVDENKNFAFIDESVHLEPGSKVASIFGSEELQVRSAHHQAVDQVGEKLKPVAFAHDGIIEATEHTEKNWVIGLQWHPEEEAGNREDRKKIFTAFVDTVKAKTTK